MSARIGGTIYHNNEPMRVLHMSGPLKYYQQFDSRHTAESLNGGVWKFFYYEVEPVNAEKKNVE